MLIHNPDLIPQEIIICDDRNLPWVNKEIKKLMVKNNFAFQSHCCSNKNLFLLEKCRALLYQFNISIEESKENYYTKLSSRLAGPLTVPKTCWSILKTFLNNKKFLAYLLFFMKTNSSQASKKKPNYLTIFL